MSEGWWWSTNEERFGSGPFDTRELAIQEAMAGLEQGQSLKMSSPGGSREGLAEPQLRGGVLDERPSPNHRA